MKYTIKRNPSLTHLNLTDDNVHLIPRLRIEHGYKLRVGGLYIVYKDPDSGEFVAKHRLHPGLAKIWANRIAANRGVKVIKHYVEAEGE